MVQTSQSDFSTSQKSLGPSTKARKHFSPWLVWVTINVSIHRILSVSWRPLKMLNSHAWDKRLFSFHGFNGFYNDPQNANLTAHPQPAETAKPNKKITQIFLFKLWIRTKVQAVSSGLFYLQANENLSLAKLFLMFYKQLCSEAVSLKKEKEKSNSFPFLVQNFFLNKKPKQNFFYLQVLTHLYIGS